MSFNLSKLFSKNSKQVKGRSLRVEGLEDRMLLAVTAGGEAGAAELVAPAETSAAEVVVTNITYNGLRAALNQVDDGGTITFDGSGTIIVTSALVLNKNLTINGGGTVTLQGAGENFDHRSFAGSAAAQVADADDQTAQRTVADHPLVVHPVAELYRHTVETGRNKEYLDERTVVPRSAASGDQFQKILLNIFRFKFKLVHQYSSGSHRLEDFLKQPLI